MRRHYIVIAGSIGTGKTTTSEAVASMVPGWAALVETRDTFLARFYDDPKKYAFLNQLAYSLQYVEQAVEISMATRDIVQDRSIYDTHQVFSQWRREAGLICEDEFELLERTFRIAHRLVCPTLLVLLECSIEVASRRIVSRNMTTELGLTSPFLSELSHRYANWFEHFDLSPKLRLSTDHQPVASVVDSILSAVHQLS